MVGERLDALPHRRDTEAYRDIKAQGGAVPVRPLTYTRKDYRQLERLGDAVNMSKKKVWKGKRITVFVNGDLIRHGSQMPIPAAINTWQLLLQKLSQFCEQQIMTLYTPKGKKIKSLDKIVHGAVYVAAGVEPFRYLTYDGSSCRLCAQVGAQEARARLR